MNFDFLKNIISRKDKKTANLTINENIMPNSSLYSYKLITNPILQKNENFMKEFEEKKWSVSSELVQKINNNNYTSSDISSDNIWLLKYLQLINPTLQKNKKFMKEFEEKGWHMSNELLQKVINNNYSLSDISSDNIWLLEYLQFNGIEAEIVEVIIKNIALNKKNDNSYIESLEHEYYVLNVDSTEELEHLQQTIVNELPSFLREIKINMESKINGFKTETYIWSDKIFSILNPVKESDEITKSTFFNNQYFGYFYHGNLTIDSNSIIVIKYDQLIELFKDENFKEKFKCCKILLSDNCDKIEEIMKKISPLKERDNIKNFIYDKPNYDDTEKIKFNHLLFIINKSNIDEAKKTLFNYQVKKIYNDATNGVSTAYWNNFEEIKKITTFLMDNINIEDIQNLTNNFNNLSNEEKTNAIEREKFTSNIFILSLDSFDEISTEDLINSMQVLDEEQLNIVLEDEKIIEKFNSFFKPTMNREEKIEIIKREIILITYDFKFNSDILKFIRNQDIDVNSFLTNALSVNKKTHEINPIIAKYKIEKGTEKINVSIRNILGHNGSIFKRIDSNVLASAKDFFNSKGDGYLRRSVGMLNLSSENIIQELSYSFETEPIVITDLEPNKYCIDKNGMHRYTILKIHYLNELFQKKLSPEELEQKYTIPVTVTKTDYFKTYCSYLIQKSVKDINYVGAEYDQNYQPTGRVKINSKEDKSYMFNDTELKEFIKNSISNLEEETIKDLQMYYNQIESFKEFIDKHFEEIKSKFNPYKEEEQNARNHK